VHFASHQTCIQPKSGHYLAAIGVPVVHPALTFCVGVMTGAILVLIALIVLAQT
jgi:hypothetical protein